MIRFNTLWRAAPVTLVMGAMPWMCAAEQPPLAASAPVAVTPVQPVAPVPPTAPVISPFQRSPTTGAASTLRPVLPSPSPTPGPAVVQPPAYTYEPPNLGAQRTPQPLPGYPGPRMQESTRQPAARPGAGTLSPGGRTVAPTYRYQGVPGRSLGRPPY